MIIILNGTSSSGKSTIAKALTGVSSKPFLHIGIDLIYSIMPEAYINKGVFADEGFKLISDGSRVDVKFGRYGQKVRDCSASLAKVFFDKKLDVIVDEVFVEDRFLRDYAQILKKYANIFYWHSLRTPCFAAARIIARRQSNRFSRKPICHRAYTRTIL